MALTSANDRKNFTGVLYPVAGSADYLAVIVTAADIKTDLVAGEVYVFSCDEDCYIKQGAAPTASAAAGSMFVPGGVVVPVDGAQGVELSVIRKSTDGVATLQLMKHK